MAGKSERDPDLGAVEEVFRALKPLDESTRNRVLSSALALLGMADNSSAAATPSSGRTPAEAAAAPTPALRPMSLVEMIQQKNPGTNVQRIALFAYHREKYEGLPRFSREDLKPYFAKARLAPASNFDRDFVDAVKKGWIHEDGSDSYLTSKGLEAVESEFSGERKYTKGRPGKKEGGKPTQRSTKRSTSSAKGKKSR